MQNTQMNSYLRLSFKWTYHGESVGLVAKQ